jgi:glutathione S-transferase
MDRLTLYGSFTSSSSYKPMLYLALASAAVFFPHCQPEDRDAEDAEYLAINRWGVVPSLRHRGLPKLGIVFY